MAPSGIGQKFYTGRVTSQEIRPPVVVEDYRSDRLILEELSAELARVHRRLDNYEELYNRWRRHPLSMVERLISQLGRGPHA